MNCVFGTVTPASKKITLNVHDILKLVPQINGIKFVFIMSLSVITDNLRNPSGGTC